MFEIRQIVPTALFLAASLAMSFGQTQPATFRTVTSNTGVTPRNVYTVDVNNDGILDIIQDSEQGANGFRVSVANGDGTFTQKYSYQFPFQYQSTIPMASGDFNGDGKVDLIFELAGSNQVALFLGNGNGTFQTPKYITIPLPSAEHFGGLQLLAADFNGDGKLDLVTGGNTNSTGALYLMLGDGSGGFGAPTLLYMPPANQGIYSIAAGDFDGDGKADIAFTDSYNCTQGGCATILNVLYNDGSSRFTDITSYSSPVEFNFSVGDLNSDGTTDVFGTVQSQTSTLVVLYAQTDRTFHTYTTAIPYSPGTLAMADFNGDSRMDLVGAGPNSNDTGDQFVFFLADTSPGMFTQQSYALPRSALSNPVVGDFNSDSKPDVLVVADETSAFPTSNSTILDALNTTATGNWGGCAYPSTGMGIRVCDPGSSATSPVTFNASANSYGQLRMMELWVDGKKVADQFHTWGSRAWFDLNGTTLAAGSHRGVMFAGDIDDRLQKVVFYFTVAGTGGCSAPASPGVNVCQPAKGSTVNSPVQVEAAATVTGKLASLELWVDGVKKYATASTTLNTSISLAAGTHRFAVLAVNTTGQKWETAVYSTVK